MKIIALTFWTFAIVQLSISFTQATFYKITRTKRWHGYSGEDNFTMPSSNCQHSEYSCSFYDALNVDYSSCGCVCRLTKSTFAFTRSENQWSCVENNEVRTKLQSLQYGNPGERGCSQEMGTLFINEYSNSTLRVLNFGDAKAFSIVSGWNSCQIDPSYSWYFGCNESRLSSNTHLNTLKTLFTLEKGHNYYILKVRNNVPDAHLLSGRIINLGILCRNGTVSLTQRRCLLFKLQGSIKCFIANAASKTSSTPVQVTTPLPTTSGAVWPVRTKMNTNQPRSMFTIAPSPTIVVSPPVVTITRGNVSAHVPISRPSPNPDHERGSDDTSGSFLGLITAVTVSSLLVLLVICLVIARCSLSSKKCHTIRSTRHEEAQRDAAVNTLSNLAFQSDEQTGYFTLSLREPVVYASTYQVPQVNRRTSFNEMTNPVEDDSNTEHVPERHDTRGPKTYPVPVERLADNASRFQTFVPTSHEQRVYNLVEDLSVACPRGPDNDGPSNGSSDGPNIGAKDGPRNGLKDYNDGPNKAEPIYHVIEEPSQENNTLRPDPSDELCTDGPVYCTLDELYSDISTATTNF